MKSNTCLSGWLLPLFFVLACQQPADTSDTSYRNITSTLKQQGELLCGNPLPRAGAAYRFDLTKCRGQFSYLDTFMQVGGINDVIDADGERRFAIQDYEHLRSRDDKFAAKVKRRIDKLFEQSSPKKLESLVGEIAGKKVSPSTMTTVVAKALEDKGYVLTMHPLQAAVRLAPYLSIANGAGSYIILDDTTRFINIGYGTGENLLKDLRKGRSFAITKDRPALDASDIDYLDGLEEVLKDGQAEAYYRAMFEFLTESDTSGIASLDKQAQVVAADFAAVYTAELDRHFMVDLDPSRYAWEQDLMEATWVSAYVVQSERLILNSSFDRGRPRDFFAQGPSGGGIGKTAKDRRLLSAAISRFLWKQTDNLQITRLASLVRAEAGDDVFHKLSDLLTDKKATLYVRDHAQAIAIAATDFLMDVMSRASEITEGVAASPILGD